MNEIATIRQPRREDYEPIVKAMRPHCQGEEMMLRSSLLLMRDRAVSTKQVACSPSWAMLDVVERESGEAALSFNITTDELREIRRICILVIGHAREFDALYCRRFSPSQGEANAKGG